MFCGYTCRYGWIYRCLSLKDDQAQKVLVLGLGKILRIQEFFSEIR